MISMLRELWLFFRRDLSIARTYRTGFLFEAIEALFGVAMLFYVARFVDSPQLQHALPQREGYFVFSLVGFVFLDYLYATIDAFDRSLQEARNTGALEHLLVTQTSLPVMLAGSAAYPFAAATLRIAVTLRGAWCCLDFSSVARTGPLSRLYSSPLFLPFPDLEFSPRAICCFSSAEIPLNGSSSVFPA